MRLAFIPARGGSKRVPRKNILPIAGKPLLAWTIDAARDSAMFDEVVVSSDDDEILSLAEEMGVMRDVRSPELSGDRITFMQVLVEYLSRPEKLGRCSEVAVLLPTCPFRTGADIRSAFALRTGDDFVVSVVGYEFSPDFACDLQDGMLQVRHPEVYAQSTQSQSRRPAYHPNGAIFLGPVRRLLEVRSFFVPPTHGYLMPPERSLDIDLPHHVGLAETLLASNVISGS
jgi:CMP-N-acetylneuraminic acid synthetase